MPFVAYFDDSKLYKSVMQAQKRRPFIDLQLFALIYHYQRVQFKLVPLTFESFYP